LWWPGTTAPVDLAVVVEHAVEAALGTDVQTPVRQDGHDLAGWKRREFRLVAGEQDPLTFFFAEAVSHMAVAAFTTVHTVPITRKLPAPALQRRQPNAQQQRQLTGPSTIGHAFIKDDQGLPTIVRRRQSSPSSPQKA
jgi:hypothetical protein